MALAALKKSTTDRFFRLGLSVTERIAPRLGARMIGPLWWNLPPGPKPRELPAGGHPFEVTWGDGHVVRGQAWGAGPTVYLVHGWGGRGDQFARMVKPLVRAGHTVVVYDAPSHGASDPGDFGPRSTTGVEMKQALAAVAEHFGPASAIVAHSMGALATLLALEDSLVSTERLVLVAPMEGYEQAITVFRGWIHFGPRILRAHGRATSKRVGLAVEDFDVRRILPLLKPRPTLVLHDLIDAQAPYDDSAAMAGGRREMRLVTTKGLGHNGILGHPESIEEIVSFVAEASLPSGI